MTLDTRQVPSVIEEIVDTSLQDLRRAVSVIIPAYNEAGHVADEIREVEQALAGTGWSFEILVVDDGSTDGTAEAAATTGARVLRRAQNRGYGASLKLGIDMAQYEWILITDADGTYPASAIPSLLDHAAGHEMIVGARTGEHVKIPMLRRPAKWFLGWLASYLAAQKLPDINSGLRLMRKSFVQRYLHVLPDGFSFTTTITLAAACNSHPVAYYRINYRPRLGESKIRPRHAYDFTMLILRTIVFFNPLRVFLPLGGILALAGIAKFIYDVTRDNLSESAVLALLGALLVWSVGLLADQNARIAMHR